VEPPEEFPVKGFLLEEVAIRPSFSPQGVLLSFSFSDTQGYCQVQFFQATYQVCYGSGVVPGVFSRLEHHGFHPQTGDFHSHGIDFFHRHPVTLEIAVIAP